MPANCKSICLSLILIAATLSPLIAQNVCAEVPEPAVPKFTLKYISGDVQVFQVSDMVGSNGSMYTRIGAVQIEVANQQYGYSNGSTFSLYYDVRVRNPLDTDRGWQKLFPPIKLLPQSGDYNAGSYVSYLSDYIWGEGAGYTNRIIPQSDSEYTTIYLPILNTTSTQTGSYPRGYLDYAHYSPGTPVEIQVKAMLGVDSTYYTPSGGIFDNGMGSNRPAAAYVTSSGWGGSQTIFIGDSDSNVTPSSSQTPSESALPDATVSGSVEARFFGLGWIGVAIVALLAIIAVLLVFVVVFLRRRSTAVSPS